MVCVMRIAPFILLAFAACAEFQALDGAINDTARDAPYPTLVALPPLLGTQPVAADEAMTARIAALNARADRLRRIDIAALQ